MEGMRILNDLDKWCYNHADMQTFNELFDEYGSVAVIEDGEIVAYGWEE